jgi:hypothetical protein
MCLALSDSTTTDRPVILLLTWPPGLGRPITKVLARSWDNWQVNLAVRFRFDAGSTSCQQRRR